MSHLRFCRTILSRVKVARQNRRCDMALRTGVSVMIRITVGCWYPHGPIITDGSNLSTPVNISVSITVTGRKQLSKSLFFFGTVRIATRRTVNRLHRNNDTFANDYSIRFSVSGCYIIRTNCFETMLFCIRNTRSEKTCFDEIISFSTPLFIYISVRHL